MYAFLYGILVRWRMDLRNRTTIFTFYIFPLLFFAFMSGMLLELDVSIRDTLIQRMTVVGVSMGAFIGCPIQLVKIYGSDVKKVYKVAGVPLWVPTVNNLISSFINLFIVSIIILFFSPIVYQAKMPSNLGAYFLHLTIFIFASIIVGIVLGLMIKNISKLAIVSQFVFIPSIILSGVIFPISMMPKVMQYFVTILPAASGYAALIQDKISFFTVFPMIDDLIVLGMIICGVTLGRLNKKAESK